MSDFLADDIADLLTSGGITTTIYRGFLMEQPDEAIAVVETGGLPPIRAMRDSAGNPVVERPSVQIVRRSLVYQRARAEMNVIWRMLEGFGDRNINGTRYQWIGAAQSPFPLPKDETKRWIWVCNFNVEKKVSTATST